MKNPKKKVVNVKTGKIIELSEIAISNLKKMGKFSEYDILPEISKPVSTPPPSSENVTENVTEDLTEDVTEEPKKKKSKSKSTEENS